MANKSVMRGLLCVAALMLLLLASCGEKKDMVLSRDKMAHVLADMHMSEGVVDLNYGNFPTDSSRLLLRESIYEANGVTRDQVDSSFVWYGNHIEDYIKVYDRTIEILEDRQGELLTQANKKITADGDSVDIWPMSTHIEFSRRAPSAIVPFEIQADSNWHNADVMRLQYKTVSASRPIIARMVIEYADGSAAYDHISGSTTGFCNVAVRVDSARSPIKITGFLMATPTGNETTIVDSISLVKMRNDLYRQYVAQRQFNYNIKEKEELIPADSVLGGPSAPRHSAAPQRPSDDNTALTIEQRRRKAIQESPWHTSADDRQTSAKSNSKPAEPSQSTNAPQPVRKTDLKPLRPTTDRRNRNTSTSQPSR